MLSKLLKSAGNGMERVEDAIGNKIKSLKETEIVDIVNSIGNGLSNAAYKMNEFKKKLEERKRRKEEKERLESIMQNFSKGYIKLKIYEVHEFRGEKKILEKRKSVDEINPLYTRFKLEDGEPVGIEAIQ